MFKGHLVEHFRRRSEARDARERYMTETYAKLMAVWTKKVERMENSKRRKEKEAKARELYEKIFPELRKQREDKERDHRLGTRGGAVRSEADIEDVIERLQEQEMEDKKMHSYAVIPPLLLTEDERRRKFTNNNGLILNPMHEYNERKFVNVWTDQEKEIFKEKFLQYPKNFGQIAQFLDRKTVSDCVQYYYLSKKTENYKQLLRRVKVRRGKRTQANQAAAAAAEAASAMASGVMTRNRRGDMQGDKGDESNRSTPQPKSEIKTEPDEEDKKGRNKVGNDSSDEEKPNVNAASGKHFCPIPSCTTTKPKMKGRLRHLPPKWRSLPKDTKEIISNELRKSN
jgi:nuclear receptor co-repressor 1